MLDDILDNIVDEVAEAIKQDLMDPFTILQLKDKIDETVMCITGVNIKHPFIYPYYQKFIQKYQDQFLELLGVVVSDPPNSIDSSAEFIKEEVSTKVDSLADRLKKKLQQKESK